MNARPGPTPYIRSSIVNYLRTEGGGVRSLEEIAEHVYGTAIWPTTYQNNIRVLIFRLRRDGFPIANYRGRGYFYGDIRA